MKRVIILVAVLVAASWAMAQTSNQSGTAQKPAAQASQAQPGTTGTQSQPGAQAQPGAPAPKHPPQAKSQEEYKAFQTATAATTPDAQEKAANDFASKFPDSELRVLLYRQAMNGYQQANNADKMVEMGRKILAIDPDDPQALIGVAEVLSERTRDTDLDFNEKTAEATKLATHALDTIDTDLMFAAGAPPDKVQAAKDWLRSTAYAILGNISMIKKDYPSAEQNLRKAIDMGKSQPDPVNYLRLAVALDKENKYPDALTTANQAVEMTQENTTVGTLARQERDRLKQLTGGNASGAPPANQPKPQPPTSPQPEIPHP